MAVAAAASRMAAARTHTVSWARNKKKIKKRKKNIMAAPRFPVTRPTTLPPPTATAPPPRRAVRFARC